MSAAGAFSSFNSPSFSAQLRRELATALQHAGVLHSARIEHALLAIPREAFVPFFYDEDETSRTMRWKQVDAALVGEESYLRAVYRDHPLVTKTDGRSWPVSSSSQPSVMVRMLEALDVQAGQRVLEIGTGSGYNAALLASILGDATGVVTVEHDAVLARHAQRVLSAVVGPGVTTVIGDGFAGWPSGAPYERIIATASVGTLPRAWVEQLQPTGKLVMDLQGSLASSFLLLEKTTEGEAQGRFLTGPLHFMPLVSPMMTALQKLNVTELLQQPHLASLTVEPSHVFPEKLFEEAFRWFLQWRLLGCQISRRTQIHRETERLVESIFVYEPRSGALLRLRREEGGRWSGDVYGAVNVWQELEYAYEDFLSLGQPTQEHYHLVVENSTPILVVGSSRLPLQH